MAHTVKLRRIIAGVLAWFILLSFNNHAFGQGPQGSSGESRETLALPNTAETTEKRLRAGDRHGFSGERKLLYDFLAENIKQVSSGERNSTIFSLNYAPELEQKSLETVIEALRCDFPYDLFWYDAAAGCEYNTSAGSAEVRFHVSAPYASGEYELDPNAVLTAKNAQDRVKAIIKKYAFCDDIEKLRGYKNTICSLVAYSDAASPNPDENDSGIWQLVWVFDDDASTNVVCEGYAKAFQYLCDNTSFSGNIRCYTVEGQLNGSLHMWNMLRMPNGKSYLADITNSDDGMVGEKNQLFLAGATEIGEDGYAVSIGASGELFRQEYIYSDAMFALYPENVLFPSSTGYMDDEKTPLEEPAELSLEAVFPDTVFRSYISDNFDSDRNGSLSVDEIQKTEYLDVNNFGIYSLEGIEHLTSIKRLYCSNNRLAKLDLSKNEMLSDLICENNYLAALDVSHNTALERVRCSGNVHLEKLDVSGLPMLKELGVSGCSLGALDVRNSPKLTYLDCRDNHLTELELSNQPDLYQFYCSSNDLRTLDLTHNSKLHNLYCEYNPLGTLDLTGKSKLYELRCGDCMLTTIDLSDCAALECLICSYNQLETLDISRNPLLSRLWCLGNRIASLDITNNPRLNALISPLYHLANGYYGIAIEGDENVVPTSFSEDENVWMLTRAELRADPETRLHYTELDPEKISIDDIHFPDAVFRQYISDKFDSDKDGFLSENESNVVWKIFLPNEEEKVSSLQGVELFPDLVELHCYNGNLTEVDVSGNRHLKTLNLMQNRLVSLDVSSNTELEDLCCSSNPISALDLSKNPKLRVLGCRYANLTEIDLSGNLKLEVLDCYCNYDLKELDVSQLCMLQVLECGDCAIEALDLSGNTQLTELTCAGNRFESLDLGHNKGLKRLSTNVLPAECSLESMPELEELTYYGTCSRPLDLRPCSALNLAYELGSKTGPAWSRVDYWYGSFHLGLDESIEVISAHFPGEVTADNLTYATCCEEGKYDAVVLCRGCGKELSRENRTIPAMGHLWEEVHYVFSEDQTSVKAERLCERDRSHTEEEIVPVSLSVSRSPGMKETGEYILTSGEFVNPAFKIQKKTGEIPALGNMTVLTLPKELNTIEENAFENVSCQAILVPEGCRTIKAGAFRGCKDLIYVYIPAETVTAEDAFDRCGFVITDRGEGQDAAGQ